MPKIMCRDYGYDCDFEAYGENEKVIEDFRTHIEEVHVIDYTIEAV